MAVREERVVLRLQDDFSSKMARAAASTALLERNLGDLDGTNVSTARSVSQAANAVDDLDRNSYKAASTIDQLSGRLRLVADLGLALGPAFVPLAATAVPAVTGLANGLGVAAVAGGVAAAAFQGVGDALSAVREYELEPTTANFEKAQAAMERLAPTAQALVVQLRDMGPALREIRDTAATEGLDGVIDGLESIEQVLPRVQRLAGVYADTLGDIAADTGESLASDRWADFLDFLEAEGPPTLRDLAAATGDVAHGLSEMWEAFDPLNDDFTGWLVDAADSFDDFASGVDQTQGLQDFFEYVEENGPKAADAVGSLANAVVQIVDAAAPLGGPVLEAIAAVADTLATVADSDAGSVLFTAAAGMAAFSRASQLWTKAAGVGALNRNIVAPINDIKKTAPSLGQVGTYFRYLGQDAQFASKQTLAARDSVRGFARNMAPAGAAVAGLGLLASGAADDLGVTNSVSLALAGTLGGPWGVAIGAAVGGLMDLRSANRDVTESVSELEQAIADTDISRIESELTQLRGEVANASLWDQVTGRVDLLNDAIYRGEDALRSMRDAAGASGLGTLLGQPMQLAGEFERAALSVDEFAQSFADLNTLLSASGTLLAYEAALDQLTASIEENGNAWRAGTDAGRANLAARNALVGQAIERSNALKEAGDELGAQRILTRAISDLQAFARQSPEARAAMKPFIAELRRLDGQEAKPKVDPQTADGRRKLRDVANDLNRVGRQRPTPQVGANTGEADRKIAGVFADFYRLDRTTATGTALANTGQAEGGLRSVISLLESAQRTVYSTVVVRRVNQIVGGVTDIFGSADGSTVPKTGRPYADRHPYLLADGEEVISNRYGQADRHRSLLKAINANRLADGGTAGGLSYTLDQRSDILGLQQSIRDLTRQLRADGKKNRLRGLAREIAQVDRQQARRDLVMARRAPVSDLRAVRSGLDLDPMASVGDTRDALGEFRRQLRDAGGEWTKRLSNMSQRLVGNARAIERSTARVERETKRRDALAEKLDEQVRALDQLRSTMDQFSSSVSGNFTANPFNLDLGGGGSPVVVPPRPVAPAELLAAQDALSAAKGRYSSALSAGGDRVDVAYAASRALAEVDQYQAQVDDLGRDYFSAMEEYQRAQEQAREAVVETLSPLEAFEKTLTSATESALGFTSNLKALAALGLDGPLFQQLAASGDMALATQLLGTGAPGIERYEDMFEANLDAAAAAGAFATQEVYGQQYAVLEAGMEAQQALVAESNRIIERQSQIIDNTAARSDRVAERIGDNLGKQIASVRQAVASIPRQQQENRRNGKGGRG